MIIKNELSLKFILSETLKNAQPDRSLLKLETADDLLAFMNYQPLLPKLNLENLALYIRTIGQGQVH